MGECEHNRKRSEDEYTPDILPSFFPKEYLKRLFYLLINTDAHFGNDRKFINYESIFQRPLKFNR